MKQPLLSIIVPIYNSGKEFKWVLGQILNDDALDVQVICVDDCSTDDSYKIIEEGYKDKKLTLLKTAKNSGAAAARNLGLSKAKGKYIAFLDSDDKISPKYFEKMIEAISEKSCVLATCGIRQRYLKDNKTVEKFTDEPVDRQKRMGWKEYILFLMVVDGRLYSSVNKIFLGDVIRENKVRFDESLNFGEDTKFVLDYLGCFTGNNLDKKLNFVLEPLYTYNYGTPTSTVASSSLIWDNWQKNYDDILEWFGHEPEGSEKTVLNDLYRRFKISHALAVARSPLSKKEKRNYLSPVKLFAAEIVVKIRG